MHGFGGVGMTHIFGRRSVMSYAVMNALKQLIQKQGFHL